MNRFLSFLLLATPAFCATIIDPNDCGSFPCLIMEDEFDTFDHDLWEHEINMAGGGNWEFQAYVNNRSVSYVNNSILYIKPQLMSEWLDEQTIRNGQVNFYSQNGRNDRCTANLNFGCAKSGQESAGGDIVNPIMSARIRTLFDFYFLYGTIEIRAKLPRGDWLWPAMWLLPHYWPYGAWPASGEVDIMESIGNDDHLGNGNFRAATTLHWGPHFYLNQFAKTNQHYELPGGASYNDDFHVWRMEWNSTGFTFYLDGNMTVEYKPTTSFSDWGDFPDGEFDPWLTSESSPMAPFDRPFYLIFNVAVGGTNGFFPDGGNKPWGNNEPNALLNFYNDIENWFSTWSDDGETVSDNAALQVDYVRVFATEETKAFKSPRK